MSDRGRIGDTVGYAVFEQNRSGYWIETACPVVDTIGQAVGVVRLYQEDRHQTTFAVARLELVMISRPEETP